MNSRIDIPVCHIRRDKHPFIAAIALAIVSCLFLYACDKNPAKANADIQLNAQVRGSNEVDLWWTVVRKPSGETWSCHLRRAEAGSDNWVELGEYFPDDEFRCTDSDVSAGTNYKYQVVARSLLETRYSNIVFISTWRGAQRSQSAVTKINSAPEVR